MFTIGFKKPLVPYNKSVLNYCMKSTKESIEKMIEKNNNLENKKINIKNILNDNDNKKPNFNFYNFFILVSVSSIGIYIYNKIK